MAALLPSVSVVNVMDISKKLVAIALPTVTVLRNTNQKTAFLITQSCINNVWSAKKVDIKHEWQSAGFAREKNIKQKK